MPNRRLINDLLNIKLEKHLKSANVHKTITVPRKTIFFAEKTMIYIKKHKITSIYDNKNNIFNKFIIIIAVTKIILHCKFSMGGS